MIQVLNTLSDAYARETARWNPTNGDFKKDKIFRVENMNESRRDFASSGNNLETEFHAITLRTRYKYPYEIGQRILYRNKWYEISGIIPKRYPTFGLVSLEEFYLSLIEVNYGRDFSED